MSEGCLIKTIVFMFETFETASLKMRTFPPRGTYKRFRDIGLVSFPFLYRSR